MIPALFSVLLLAADPAAAAQPSPPAPMAATEVPKKKEKLICRTNEANTGSRVRKNICLTPTQWTQRQQGKSFDDLKTIGAR